MLYNDAEKVICGCDTSYIVSIHIQCQDLFPGVLSLWHFLYSVDPHPVSSLHIYTFVVSRAFMAGAAYQAGDAESSRAPGLTSGLQGSVNVHRGALLLVSQWQCISSFVFYIVDITIKSCYKHMYFISCPQSPKIINKIEKVRYPKFG